MTGSTASGGQEDAEKLEVQPLDSDFLRAASGTGESTADGTAAALGSVSGLLSGLAGAFESIARVSPLSPNSPEHQDHLDEKGGESPADGENRGHA